jgi:hypothetical protein
MTDATVDGTYAFTCPADGQNAFFAVAVVDPVPTPGTPPEHVGTYNYDGSAPIVDAGIDHLIPTVGAPFLQDATVDASISGVLSYAWIMTAGPGIVTFVTADIEDPMVSADTNGVYTIQLTVTDNAGNSASDTTQFEWLVGGATTAWDIYNGQNFRTFSSALTPGWGSDNLAMDVIAYINANYPAELLENWDVSITMYDSVTGLYTNCFWFIPFNMWMNVFPLVEGHGYIIEIAPGALLTQPRAYTPS